MFFLALILISYSCKRTTSDLSDTKKIEDIFSNLKQQPEKLASFFKIMPKGGDIHHHASGSPYAEYYINNALKDSCYIDTTNYQLYPNSYKTAKHKNKVTVLLNDLLQRNPNEKDSLINYWSVRNYKKYNRNAHYWFFNTFLKFGPAFIGHEAEMLTILCLKAKKDKVSYLETIIRVQNIQDSIAEIAAKNSSFKNEKKDATLLSNWYAYFEENNISNLARVNADSLDSYMSKTDRHGVTLKFQTYALRLLPNQAEIFGQLIVAFKTAELTPNLVGVNFVAPEDNKNALENFDFHMQMFQFLKKKHPTVNISLHAGELTLGKGDVKKSDLTTHIYESIFTAKATRIGHGVDLLSETNKTSILKIMKDKGIAVEINLKSNETILGTSKSNHPLRTYLEYGVPVCISSDDEGVLRTSLTEQYSLLVEYYPEITFLELKEIVFNSITYSFLDKNKKQKLLNTLKIDFKEFENNLITP